MATPVGVVQSSQPALSASSLYRDAQGNIRNASGGIVYMAGSKAAARYGASPNVNLLEGATRGEGITAEGTPISQAPAGAGYERKASGLVRPVGDTPGATRATPVATRTIGGGGATAQASVPSVTFPTQTLPTGTQPIDPEGSLRATQINPGVPGDFSNIAQFFTTAAGEAANVPNPSLSPEALQARQAASQASTALSTLPDRVQLALNAYNRFRTETAPQHAADLRAVGQRAAALGRIGAGMTTTELSDLELARQRDLDRRRQELIDTATAASVGDRIARLNAQLGAGASLGGQDISLAEANALAALRRAGLISGAGTDISGLEAQRFGQEATLRGELRGERARQDELAQQSIENRLRQLMAEEALYGSDFNRRLQIEQLAAQLSGSGGAGILINAAGQAIPQGPGPYDMLYEYAVDRGQG